jgi:hypothetical protein
MSQQEDRSKHSVSHRSDHLAGESGLGGLDEVLGPNPTGKEMAAFEQGLRERIGVIHPDDLTQPDKEKPDNTK